MSFRQVLSDRKRLALVGALAAALLAGAIAISLTVDAEDDPGRSGAQRTERSGTEGQRDRPNSRGGDFAAARNRADRRRPSSGGDSRAGRKLPRDLVRELRRRKIPVIELTPGKGGDVTGGLQGGERLDPRTLGKLLEQKQ